MITDIPTQHDFEVVGMQLLNVAWDTAATLVCDLNLLDYRGVEEDQQNIAYWRSARIQLNTGLAIAQQGSEFLLKARIAREDPYMLLGGEGGSGQQN